jgi:hypothetical protein
MKCYVREIAIFDTSGNKRGIKLGEGLNIITGESQSGKSALIEIVDYCLLASRSTIPRGKITDFADLFAIVLELDDIYIVLGRPSPKRVDSNKQYFKVEFSESAIKNLTREYFNGVNLVSRDALKKDFGRYFGFDVSDITTEESSFRKKEGRASFRNMTPYLFQHQSLIANKHAIFYRFDNRDVQLRVINEFPIFMGWVDGEYYGLRRDLDRKERRLRLLQREKEELEKNKGALKGKLERYVADYYRVIGVPLPVMDNLFDLVKLAQHLPPFEDKSYIIGNIEGRLVELTQERADLVDLKGRITRDIELLELALDNTTKYSLDLVELSGRSNCDIDKGNYCCPLCEQELKSFNTSVDAVRRSRAALFADLQKMRNYSIDNTETIERLKRQRDEIKQQILTINGEIRLLKDSNVKDLQSVDLRQRATEIKNLIEVSLEVAFGESNILSSNEEISELNNEIRVIKANLDKYNIDAHREKFQEEINQNMNNICSKLDFEEELRPPNLKFNLEDFNFYHELRSNDKITISEMGSGANWLACHLSIFLGLHKQFAKSENCSIPSFIFFDQPSQVYFPKEFEPTKDKDVRNVANIYDVILDTIGKIKAKSGLKIQVVVTDHADNLNLKNGDFDSFVKARWFNGEKLI